jgi:hypothetical protein
MFTGWVWSCSSCVSTTGLDQTTADGLLGPVHRPTTFAPLAGPDRLVRTAVTGWLLPGLSRAPLSRSRQFCTG